MTKDYSNNIWQSSGLQPTCHVSPKLAFEIGNLQVYGSTNRHVWREVWDLEMPFLEQPRADYLPSVTSKLPDDMAAHFDPRCLEVRSESNFIATVCRDGHAPYLTEHWWQWVANGLASAAAAKTEGPYRVCVYCYGGHGRTGTALAILAHFLGLDTGDLNVVDYLRLYYCEEAIETTIQVNYIGKITGLDVTDIDGSYTAITKVYKAKANEKVVTIDGETFDIPGFTGSAASNTSGTSPKHTVPSYNFSTTPYVNRMLGAAPPLGWDYIIQANGETHLARASRKFLKHLKRTNQRPAIIPDGYNLKGVQSRGAD